VIGLLAGGVVAAPIAAYVVRKLPARVLGTLVGVLVVVVNARTLLLAQQVGGPARLAVLAGLVAVGSLLVARSALVVRAGRLGIPAPEAEPVAALDTN
jgi:hypothetical protein